MTPDFCSSQLREFIERHGIDPLRSELLGSAAANLTANDPSGPASTEQLRVYQRLFRIASAAPETSAALLDQSDGKWANALISRGLTSANHVAAVPEFKFVAEHAEPLGGEESARAFHRNAAARASLAKHFWANVKDSLGSPHYAGTRFFNIAPSLAADVADIPSYQDLFGGLDYIVCPHCSSIFGPAAYFLDLMRIIDLYITDANKGTIPTGFKLEERRPDLFNELKLTCANTDQPVPLLSIIDAVLAARIRSEVKTDAAQAVATARYPFNLPFNQPWAAVRTNLPHLDTTLYAIYQQFGAASPAPAREFLGISAEAYTQLVTVSDTASKVAPEYGAASLDLSEIAKLSEFCRLTGLTRQGLNSLLIQEMNSAELARFADTFFINATGENLPYMRIVTDISKPEDPFEKIDNLSVNRLDRLSRFIRLTAFTGWSYADTNWAMASIGATEIEAAIPGLAAWQRLRDRVSQPIDVTVALGYLVKNVGRGSSYPGGDLFDRVFNNPALLTGDPYTQGSKQPFDPDQPLPWTVNGTTAEDRLIRRRLMAALNVSDNDLTAVAEYERCLLNAPAQLAMNLVTLTALYRFTRIPQLAKIAIPDYLVLLRLMYGSAATPCANQPPVGQTLTVAQIEELIAQFDTIVWTKTSGFTPPHLQYVMTGTAPADFDTGYNPSQIVPFVNSLALLSEPARLTRTSFVFEDLDAGDSDQLFDDLKAAGLITALGIRQPVEATFEAIAPLLPVSKDFAKRAIGEANSKTAYDLLVTHKILVPTQNADVSVLSAAFTPATDLTWLFPSDANMRDQVRSILLQVRRDIDHTVSTLDNFGATQEATAIQGVAGFLGTDSNMMAVLIPFSAGELDVTDYVSMLLTPLQSGDPIPIALGTLMASLAQGMHLVRMLQYTWQETLAVVKYPAAFNIRTSLALSVKEIISLWTFKQLTKAFKDANNALLTYLEMPDSDAAEKKLKLEALAALTGWDYSQIVLLADRFWPSGKEYGTVDGVARLKAAFELSAGSGLEIQSLIVLEKLSELNLDNNGSFNAAAWKDLDAAANLTLDAINARVSDAAFQDLLATLGGGSDTRNRDAFAPYLLWLLGKPPVSLRRISDLYQYLLIDVEATSCDSVSYIAQGIASVQLYMQRCRLGIEPGVDKLPIPDIWWDWMTQYRVWEANRKVFLYPENYVDPTLRRSRTPQFSELQDALLQTDIRDQTVEEALRTYLDGFSALAQLRIVASYRIAIPDATGQNPVDTLFLIGRSSTDPYTFYWRKVEYLTVVNKGGSFSTQAAWQPWQQIKITMAAPWVTPVYAFGKLMIYWVEFEKVTNSIINDKQQSEDHTVWTASLKYTFTDFRGSWIQPQTLQSSAVVDFIPDTTYLQDTFIDPVVFSPEQMYWQRVYAILVPAGRSNLNEGQEQLVLIYGNQFTFMPGKDVIPIKPPDDRFPERLTLNTEIFTGMRSVKLLSTPGLKARGSLVMKAAAAISNLLIPQNQRAILLNSLPDVTVPTPYTGQMADQVLAVVDAPSPLLADYYFDQTIPRTMPAPGANALAAGSVPLLNTIAPTNTSMWTVKNQPGWFVYDNGDDAFLVSSQQQPLYRIDTILHATTELDLFPAGYYLYTDAFTSSTTPLNEIKFAFTRLGTHTIAELSRRLFAGGIPTLLSVTSQQAAELPLGRLGPTSNVIDTTTAQLDFNGAYGDYFWEVFFHSAFLIGERLRASGRYGEARVWFQYIFDPTARPDSATPAGSTDQYWRFLPFRSFTKESLIDLLTNVAQITAYNNDPFNPDRIARLRTSAYPKAIVLRYIDNLLDWGDALFTQDTRESITQATNVYVLASDLLGKRPENVRVFQQPAPKTYAEIRAIYDTTGMAQSGTLTTIQLAAAASSVDRFYNGLPIEILAGACAGQRRTTIDYVGSTRVATVSRQWDGTPDATSKYQILSIPEFLIDLENTPISAQPLPAVDASRLPYNDINAYFCVPENEELVAYWDRVEDRLFKIRHCMNIQGVVRPLALFEPPLDVRGLVQAAASGNSGIGVDHTPAPPIPFYRFEYVIDRAKELAATLIQLGSELLSALASGDAEALNLLQSTQQRKILNLTTQIRVDQVNENIANRAALDVSRTSAVARGKFYKDLIQKALSPSELANLQAMEAALLFNVLATAVKTAATIGYALPQFGSPFAMTYGGAQIGNALNAMAGVFEIGSYVSSYIAQRTQTMAGYERRSQDWELQATLADFDTQQIDAQIQGNSIQQRQAERELTVHQENIAQNQELDDFYRRKFTNRELFQWMAGRLSTVYFQTYTIAFDLARSAQSAYQYETNVAETFVKFDYRDPAYRGLLAGEALLLSLNQMQSSFLAKRGRTLEIEKTISLAQLDPLQLLALRETGECFFAVTERLLDLDYPGHYCRKIKTIALTIPAVVGPFQNLKATLTQESNQIVLGPDPSAVRFLLGEDPQSPPGPDKLRTNWLINQQIALSSGVNDAGMFELSFSDPRYLPFEGTGAVSTWRLSMPPAANRIDFSSISDVTISLRYTALDGGEGFRKDVTDLAPISSYASGRLYLLSRTFPTEWFAFLHQHPSTTEQGFKFAVGAGLIPPHVSDGEVTGVYLQLLVKDNADAANGKAYIRLRVPGQPDISLTIGANNSVLVPRDIEEFAGTWELAFILGDAPPVLLDGDYLNPASLLDMALVIYYKGVLNW